ncbi:ABC transporter substrate-binding protein [Hippea maritima]|uniref:ABC-type transporter, periplasmic subunit n=1 Tax=Hippea maritima (strain ATCC 700847 / DSM 10411 / MH2) TaxID=760142 RepID=F2LXA4_HIPMA|nr:ABC transporter substrate-binding protein [Hippea maritima]AEA34218.1 ABC-type transporter, periplasmic subunit [Hippea maritima DSM 10411]
MKRFFKLLLFLVITLGISLPQAMAISQKDYIIIGTTDKVSSLDPAKAYDYLSDNILQNIMEGLVKYVPGTAKIVPGLAQRWAISKDGLTYTFWLKKNLKFSNGDPINAQAFKYSIERVIKLKGEPSFLLSDIVKNVEVVNDSQFRIHLKYAFAPFINILAFTVSFPVDPKIYKNDAFYNGLPISSGPYMVKKWVRGQQIELVRNPHYHGDKAKTPIVLIKLYRNANALYIALLNKEIDVAYRTLLPQQFKQIKKNKNFKTMIGPSPFIREVVFNVKYKPFDNPKIRKAFAYAINRTQIINDVFNGQVSPLYTLIPEGMWGHKSVMPHYNQKKAIEILKSLGYSKANPLKITLWYSPSHYGSTEAAVALTIKNQLEATGLVKCQLKSAEWATYIDYWTKGVMGMFLLGWYPDYFDPDDYMWPFLATSASPQMGCFYSNKKVDELLLKARKLTDTKDRAKVYEQVQDIMAQDAPYIPLFQGKQRVVLKPNIEGVLLDPLQIFRYYLIRKK